MTAIILKDRHIKLANNNNNWNEEGVMWFGGDNERADSNLLRIRLIIRLFSYVLNLKLLLSLYEQVEE